jgi:hemolysin activation/secretion protein
MPPAPPAPRRDDTTARFVLHSAEFDGATVVSAKRLQRAWADYRGRPVSLADLRAIGRRAERVYAWAGYPFVAVRLKVQQVKDGVVHYDVVEGRITELTVLGSNPVARRQATRMLDPVVNRAPLSLAEVNNAYALVRQIPGLSTSGTLRQGGEPGGMDLVVATKREDTIRTYANVNNLYADSVGPWGVLLGADVYGDSDFGDVGSAQVYSSLPVGRQVLVRGSYSRGLDVSGDRLIVSGLWGQAHPAQSAEALALATDVVSARVELAHPILEAPDRSLVADLAFDASDQRTRIFKASTLSNDKLRTLSLNISGEETNSFGRWAGSVEVRQGIDVLNASHRGDANLSRLGGDPQPTVAKASFEGQSASFHRLSLAVRADVQYAANPLTVPDQYAFTNLGIGRGYQPGLAQADSAVATSIEGRIDPLKVGSQLQAQPFLFVDTARLFTRGSPAYSLTSYGGGVKLQVAGRFETDITFAVPADGIPGTGGIPGLKRPSPSLLLNMTVSLNDLYSVIHNRLAKETAK